MVDSVPQGVRRRAGHWYLRAALAVFTLLAVGAIYVTNQLLTQRYTETISSRAELRLALYSANLMSELQRSSVVPQLLARDPELISALNSRDYSLSTARLMTFVEEINAASLTMLDSNGRVVAATDRAGLGADHQDKPFFYNALAGSRTVYSTYRRDDGGYSFIYSRKIETNGEPLGVIMVEVDVGRLERGWAGVTDAVLVTDAEGTIIMATEPLWRGLSEQAALARQPASTAIERAFRATQAWASSPAEAYLRGEAVLRREARVPHQGWRIVNFTTYDSVREKVNGILALQVMGFAIILAVGFWFLSRKTASRLVTFQRDAAELRALNRRLQREIAEREKVEKTLQVAEQTIAQSSKLAALGEMSAAVSHELNQPLAAMKTYLAGARLLLQRQRPEEALSSFQRIDDLLERMGAITRQLKSYARKGSDAFEPVDTRAAVSSALAMMEPQLKTRAVNIIRTFPNEPVMILGDRLRLEQVIINLLRNALDATKTSPDPTIEILLAAGDLVSLQIHDNGEGIEDLDELFTPFYTTKQPGDGVGLGLAISSGIVNDLGGRLTARNAANGGAIFEVQLPALKQSRAAAE
ncbi:ATP-binding protein [Yoonia sp.]|uniref:sensor histidine kinase n=1 Tax=Yoonia sp. TaxID=2212373 RepID=UPI0039193B13